MDNHGGRPTAILSAVRTLDPTSLRQDRLMPWQANAFSKSAFILSFFKPASIQEKGFIVLCESVCPYVCCRRSKDTSRKVTFST